MQLPDAIFRDGQFLLDPFFDLCQRLEVMLDFQGIPFPAWELLSFKDSLLCLSQCQPVAFDPRRKMSGTHPGPQTQPLGHGCRQDSQVDLRSGAFDDLQGSDDITCYQE